MASETTPPGQPEPLVIPTGEPWTPEQITWFRERLKAAMANPGPLRVLPSDHWKDRAEAAEAKLAEVREGLAATLTDTGDELGVLERPADDSAMLDRALRLIGRLVAITGSDEEARDA